MRIAQETNPHEALSTSEPSKLDHSPEIACSIKKLPYAPHQRVEFLNIQAETEALLQQLYMENYRRKLVQHS